MSEFIASPTAEIYKIDNTPNLQVVYNLQYLCIHVLQPLRDAINMPILIGSGYRCKRLNISVGGVTNSQHMTGQACDIHIKNDNYGNLIFEWIKANCTFDQLIKERAYKNSKKWWIHVSCVDGYNRKQVITNLIKNN